MFSTLYSILVFALLAQQISTSPIAYRPLVAAAASSHNLYLLTCTKDSGKVTGIGYFETPIKGSSNQPYLSATISSTYPWEGYTLQGSVWLGVTFKSEISENAQSLPKGEIAGYVSLGQEQFVCFKDGKTIIPLTDGDGNDWGQKVTNRDIGLVQTVQGEGISAAYTRCLADYWCGSVS